MSGAEVKVTQRARDAAAQISGHFGDWYNAEAAKRGQRDDGAIVQVLARFEAEIRQSAQADLLAALEVAREVVDGWPEFCDGGDPSLFCASIDKLAAAIEKAKS